MVNQIAVKCKFCGATAGVVLYGIYKGTQRYYCKQCRRKFVNNAAPPGMRTPVEQISSALSMAYEAMSLGTIQRFLRATYGNLSAISTINEWTIKFTKKAVSVPRDQVAHTDDVWLMINSRLKIGDANFWLWDVLDYSTQFLLTSSISSTRRAIDIEFTLLQALRYASRRPKIVVTNALLSYSDGIERAFGADTNHALSKNLGKQATKDMARFKLALKKRNIILRGLRDATLTELVVDGWLVHYNFFRPNSAIMNKTPAQAARLTFPYNNWAELVRNFKVKNKQPQPSRIKSAATQSGVS